MASFPTSSFSATAFAPTAFSETHASASSQAFDAQAFGRDSAFSSAAHAFGHISVPGTPAPGMRSFGAYTGGGSGIGKERKQQFAQFLNEALRAPSKRKPKAPTRQEREQAAAVERLIASLEPLPTPAPLPRFDSVAQVRVTKGAAVQVAQPRVSADSQPVLIPAEATGVTARIAAEWDTEAIPLGVLMVPMAVLARPSAVGVHNLRDDEMAAIARLAHDLSQPRVPAVVGRPGH